jgi:hypothetical protein
MSIKPFFKHTTNNTFSNLPLYICMLILGSILRIYTISNFHTKRFINFHFLLIKFEKNIYKIIYF